MNARADSVCMLEKILASAAQTVRRKGVPSKKRSSLNINAHFANHSKAAS
jgi:hypothetical protein